MKQFGFLFATALSYEPKTYNRDDCPSVVFPANKRWTWHELNQECQPLEVEVTCSSSSITVKFHSDHIYAELDESHKDQATSAAFVGTCESNLTQSTNGFYEVTFGLDDCGTKVFQDIERYPDGSRSGGIGFMNTIQGSV